MDPYEQSLSQRLQQVPDDWAARLEWIERLVARGEGEQARAVLFQARIPAQGEAAVKRLVQAGMRGRFGNDLLRKIVDRFLTDEPRSRWGHQTVAHLLVAARDLDRARYHYGQARSVDPDFRDPQLEAAFRAERQAPPSAPPAAPTAPPGHPQAPSGPPQAHPSQTIPSPSPPLGGQEAATPGRTPAPAPHPSQVAATQAPAAHPSQAATTTTAPASASVPPSVPAAPPTQAPSQAPSRAASTATAPPPAHPEQRSETSSTPETSAPETRQPEPRSAAPPPASEAATDVQEPVRTKIDAEKTEQTRPPAAHPDQAAARSQDQVSAPAPHPEQRHRDGTIDAPAHAAAPPPHPSQAGVPESRAMSRAARVLQGQVHAAAKAWETRAAKIFGIHLHHGEHPDPDVNLVLPDIDKLGHVPDIVVAEGEIVKGRRAPSGVEERKRALLVAIGVHVVVLIAVLFVVVAQPPDPVPQITARTPPNLEEATSKARKDEKKPPPAMMKTARERVQVAAVDSFSPVALSDLEIDIPSDSLLAMGEDFGMGMSLGASGGEMVSFFGSKSVSKRVVFVVDFSSSMIDGDRHQLMRDELTKTLEALPASVEYQLIFFAGPAWYAGDVVEEKERVGEFVATRVESRSGSHVWYEGWDPSKRHTGDATSTVFHYDRGADSLPRAGYIRATPENILKSVEQVKSTNLVFGTDWRWPMRMAMNMMPDTIYFMTDGLVATKGGMTTPEMIRELLAYNKGQSSAKIIAISMMLVQARPYLEMLSEGTGGEYIHVRYDGVVLKGRDLDNL